jgi:hypothetical protein
MNSHSAFRISVFTREWSGRTRKVYDELNAFTVGKRPEDDITLVIIKVEDS